MHGAPSHIRLRTLPARLACHAIALLCACAWLLGAGCSSAHAARVLQAPIEGAIDPVTAEFTRMAIDRAREED